jgi:hypothetical protein
MGVQFCVNRQLEVRRGTGTDKIGIVRALNRLSSDGASVEMWYKVRVRTLTLAVLILTLAPSRTAAQNDAPSLPVVTKFECPQYPQKARQAHVAGIVIMLITTDGHGVSDVKIIRGARTLEPFAEANVRTWKFAEHTPTTFTVTYVYAYDGNYKKDPVTKCGAKMELPEKVTVSAENPPFTDHH